MNEKSQIDQLAQEALGALDAAKQRVDTKLNGKKEALARRGEDLAVLGRHLDHWRALQEKSSDTNKPGAMVVIDKIRTKLARWSYQRKKDKYHKKYGEED